MAGVFKDRLSSCLCVQTLNDFRGINGEKKSILELIHHLSISVDFRIHICIFGLYCVIIYYIHLISGLQVAVDVSKANKMAIQDEGTLMKATTKTLASRKFGSSVVGSGDDDLLWG